MSENKEKTVTKVEEVKAPARNNRNMSKANTAKPVEKANTAIVYRGKHEVRRFTKDIHGADFEKLAKTFALRRELEVVLKKAEHGVVCEACGHVTYIK